MKKPLVSILMSTYNWSKYIEDSIESVLKQTYDFFEFIIIDDYSSDNIEKIVKYYLKKDKRICYIKNNKNIWLTKSLNRWLSLAKWKYIARIDDDDLWNRKKLKNQVDFLEENDDCWIIWTNFRYIDKNWKIIWNRVRYETDDKIKATILRVNPFVHASVLFRKNLLEKVWNYNEKCLVWQDYDLWLRIWEYSRMHNLQQILTSIRLTNNSISSKNVKKQHKLWFIKCLEYKKVYPNFIISFFYRLLFLLIPKRMFEFIIFMKWKVEKFRFS